MSVISRLDETIPNFGWIVGSLPLAVGLDLALGDLPGRTHAVRGLNWLIEVVDGAVQATVTRLGGGRGGELFGGLLLTTMVVGTTTSLVWLLVELGDTIGGVASLAVRSGLIAAGLVIRATGERITPCHRGERLNRGPELAQRGRGTPPPPWLNQEGVHPVCLAFVGGIHRGRDRRSPLLAGDRWSRRALGLAGDPLTPSRSSNLGQTEQLRRADANRPGEPCRVVAGDRVLGLDHTCGGAGAAESGRGLADWLARGPGGSSVRANLESSRVGGRSRRTLPGG